MSSSKSSGVSSLLGVLKLYRDLIGRRLYILVVLMPLSAVLESFGIALLLPLLQAMGGESDQSSNASNILGIFEWTGISTEPYVLLTIIGIVFTAKACIKFASEGLLNFYTAKLMLRLKSRCIAGYSNMDHAAFASRNTGHYINIITTQIQRLAKSFGFTMHMAVHFISSLVFLAAAAAINWKFALVAVLGGLAITFPLQALNAKVRKISRETASEMSLLNKQLVQVIQTLKYLIATNRSERFLELIHSSCHRLFQHQYRTGLAHAFVSSIREPLSVLLVILLVTLQVYFFNQGLAPALVALLLLHRTTQAFMMTMGEYQKSMELSGSAELVHQEISLYTSNQEPRGDEIQPEFQASIEFKDVTFAYDPHEASTLSNITLTIPKNHTIALVGRSGAGKSTLADLVSLLIRPDTGSILIDGQDTRNIDPLTWRRQLGYVCQDTVIFDDTIAANICLDDHLYHHDDRCRERVHEAARQAFAADFINSLPMKYGTVVGDRGVRLSGGQRQRLFIARELYNSPNLLILDEATSALDGEAEMAIRDSLELLHHTVTVIVIAHRLATIKHADYIYVLDNGKIVEEGPYEALCGEQESIFRSMLETQSL